MRFLQENQPQPHQTKRFTKNRIIWVGIFLGMVLECVLVKDISAQEEMPILNTPDNIPVPHTTYPLLYTIHSGKAVLIQNNKTNYTLVLHDVHEYVNYQFSTPPVASGVVKIRKFLTMWQSKSNNSVEADVTGVQRDNKTIGHSQFYVRALLSHPIHSNKFSKDLSFKLLITSPKLDTFKNILIENVSIFINACDLCVCAKEKITCDKE